MEALEMEVQEEWGAPQSTGVDGSLELGSPWGAQGLVIIEAEGSLVDDDGRVLVYAGTTQPLKCQVGNIEVNSERELHVKVPLYGPKERVVPSHEDMLRLSPFLSAHSAALAASFGGLVCWSVWRRSACLENIWDLRGWGGTDYVSGEGGAALAAHMQALVAQREALDAGALHRTYIALSHWLQLFYSTHEQTGVFGRKALNYVYDWSLGDWSAASPPLLETFEPLLRLVKEMQGVRIHTVELSEATLGTTDAGVDLMELPEGLRALAPDLRGLRVSSAMLDSLPEWIGELVHVEKMSIDGFSSADWANGLRDLPNSFEHLTRLQSLELARLYSLESLPPALGKLTNLERLIIEGGNDDLPLSLGVVSTNLKELSLKEYYNLEHLPHSMGAFVELRCLELRSVGLLDLPSSFGELTALEELRISGANWTELPKSIGLLVGLRALEVGDDGGSVHLTSLSPSIFATLSNLTSLTICCHALTELPSSMLATLRLTSLKLSECRALLGPLQLAPLTALTTLEVSSCRQLSLSPPHPLKMLKLYDCNQMVKDLPGFIGTLTALRVLTLECGLGCRVNLTRARLAVACSLPSLPSIESLCLGESFDDSDEEALLMIGLALRAWPKPSLTICRSTKTCYSDPEARGTSLLCDFSQELGLPVEAYTTPWEDERILRFFVVQQQKLEAFVCGQHRRLGAVSKVACLDDHTLSIIADEVLGRRVFDASLCMTAGMAEREREREIEEFIEEIY
jgi:hypothetical protein